jgi:hypothetical protein
MSKYWVDVPEIEPELPMEARLTSALGLPGVEYAHNHYLPEEYEAPQRLREKRRELARLAFAALARRALPETLAKDLISHSLFLSAVSHCKARPIAYHGSPYDLTVLKPSQPQWNDFREGRKHRYADGQPAVCASPTTKFPVMRAVLHSGHPALAELPMYLCKSSDASGRTTWFTSEEAIDCVRQEGIEGRVHILRLYNDRLPEPRRSDEVSYRLDRDEYRIRAERQSLVSVPVGLASLPTDLCVIPAEDCHLIKFMSLYQNPREWGDEQAVPVRPLGGLWPMDYLPA